MGPRFHDDFMTQNNLSDQLSWLLANINLTTPSAPSLPPVREPAFSASASSASDESAFFTPTAGLSPVTGPSNSSVHELYPVLPEESSPPSASANGASVSSRSALRPPEVPQRQTVAGDNMGRLVSLTNSRRPNLVLRQELLSPASTTTGPSLSSDYSALLAKNSAKKRTPARNANATSESRSNGSFLTPGPSVPSLRSVDTVDLTNGGGSSRTTAFGSDTCLWAEDIAARPEPVTPSEGSIVEFGRDRMVWREDYASRPGPGSTDDDSFAFGSDVMVWEEQAAWRPEPESANRGKKRKSDQMSQPPPATSSSQDFLDIDDILSDDDLLHSMAKRSPTKSPARSKLKTSPSKPISSMTSVTKTPSKARTNFASDIPSIKPQRSQPSPVKTPKKSSTLDIVENTPSDSDSVFGANVDRVLKSGAKSPTKTDDRVIQDSDDDILTSPVYKQPRKLMALPDSPTKQIRGSQRDRIEVQNSPAKIRTPISSQNATVPQSTRKKDLHKQVQTTLDQSLYDFSIDSDDGVRNQADAQSDDKTLSAMLELFLREPSIIEIKRASLEESLRQNKESFRKSLQEGNLQPRERLRRDKEQLMKQQSCLDTLTAEYRSYEELVAKKDALIARIAEAYEHDLNTDDDESHLQELDTVLKSRQELLKTHLLNADIKDPADYEHQLAHGLHTHHSEAIVRATQFVASEPTIPRSLSRESSQLPSAGGPQVIMQTQLPARLDAHQSTLNYHSGEPFNSQGRVQQLILSPRRPVRSDNCSSVGANGSRLTTSAPYSIPDDDMVYDGDDHFDDQDLLSLSSQNLHKTTRAPQHSGATHRNQRTETTQSARYDSDYSDGIDFSEFTQNIESRQPSLNNAASRSARTALSETSGNLGVSKGKLVAKKKQNTTATPVSPDQKKYPWYKDVRRALKDRFRMNGFRHNQLAAINATLAGKDAFVLMPTGGGKSLCYQLPAVVTSGKTNGITVVVSPLLSLMHDQVEHLKALNIAAKAFNGDTPTTEKRDIMNVLKGSRPEHHLQLLYVTPEMISKSTNFLNGLTCLYDNNKLARLVIDEAHCVSQWGHDFRPDYKALGEFRERFPGVPLMALTATATQNVIMDVKHNLNIPNCELFSQSFNRPNLYYEVRRKEKENIPTIAELINTKYPGKTGIVYTLSRKSAESIAKKLREHGIASHHYHASVDVSEKIRIQREWQKGKIKVVVATIAFGMGIDKPDVRFVIHQTVPMSLEGYYQETGRAGRDGEASECYLYFNYGDVTQLRKLISDGDGNEQQKERQRNMLNTVTAFCDNQSDCRRAQILRYFGETFSKSQCNGTCDNCKSKAGFEQKNFTKYAIAVLQLVKAEKRITLAQCTDHIIGKRKKSDFNPIVSEIYGIAKNMPKHEIHRVVYRLFAEDALREENVFRKAAGMAFQYYSIGRTANAFLSNGRQLWLTTRVKSADSLSEASEPQGRSSRATSSRKETSGQFPSTLVSSPTRKSASKRKGKAVATQDDDSDGDFGMHNNGYARDGFVVGDDEDSDNDFEPRPATTSRRRNTRSAGAPISQDTRLREESLTDVQKDILEQFFDEIKKQEERVRVQSGRRQPLFSQFQLREMGLRWTITLDQMRQIPNIDADAVSRHGEKFLPLIQRHHRQYREIMGLTPPPRATPYLGEIVDLVSTDDDDDDDYLQAMEAIEDDDFDFNDEEEVGQTSGYFQLPIEDMSFEDEDMDRSRQYNQPEASSSRSRPRNSGEGTSSRGRGNWRGGKKQYSSRRSSGGSKFAGVKKKGTSNRRSSGGGHTSRNSGTTSRSGGSSARGGKGGSKASGVGFDGIGLMDH